MLAAVPVLCRFSSRKSPNQTQNASRKLQLFIGLSCGELVGVALDFALETQSIAEWHSLVAALEVHALNTGSYNRASAPIKASEVTAPVDGLISPRRTRKMEQESQGPVQRRRIWSAPRVRIFSFLAEICGPSHNLFPQVIGPACAEWNF